MKKTMREIADAKQTLAQTMDDLLAGKISVKEANATARKYGKKGRELEKLFNQTFPGKEKH